METTTPDNVKDTVTEHCGRQISWGEQINGQINHMDDLLDGYRQLLGLPKEGQNKEKESITKGPENLLEQLAFNGENLDCLFGDILARLEHMSTRFEQANRLMGCADGSDKLDTKGLKAND